MTSTKPSSSRAGYTRFPTLSDLLADDVREYFLRESDCDHEIDTNTGNGGTRLPQSREGGEHPLFHHPGIKSKVTQPYSYLSASSDSDIESIDSGGVGRSSSTTSSSLFHGVTKTMTSDTPTSGGGWSNSSDSPRIEGHTFNVNSHPQDKPDSFTYLEGDRGEYHMQRQKDDNDDPQLLNDRCYTGSNCGGGNFSEQSGSTILEDDSNYSSRSSDSSDSTSLNSEHHRQQDDHDVYHRMNYEQQTPLSKLVRFHNSLELNHDNERSILLGNNCSGDSTNYASMNTSPSVNETNRTSRRKTEHCKTMNRRLGGPGSIPLRLDDAIDVLREKMNAMLLRLELLISNMPSLVGSLALAWCSMGVDWFKWYEVTFDTCRPTNYHSQLCVYTEFPGCFVCETDRGSYQFFLQFHYLCSTIAFILSSFFVGKIIIAFPVVRDELANPTTAAPLGLLCMAFEKVFAGNFGYVGEGITFFVSALQTAVGCWFIFISVVYKTLPEPSWFPNTTGIGLGAVKMFLYWTMGAYFLSGFSLVAFSMFYIVSLYRIHTNEKISLPVCWVQLSGPAVVLYGFTIFSQPGSFNDNSALIIPENKERFIRVHLEYYMPVLNVLFAFCMISMASSLYLLRARWKIFKEKQFSPAHVSFCAPLITHANAIQAYISSLNLFSPLPPGSMFMLLLYNYWTFCLICGTVLVLAMTREFGRHLPGWCHLDVEDDEMPPEPEKTLVRQLLQRGDAGDSMNQSFVSAAVLQANESGALVRVLRNGQMKYVRSRRMPSMGFDPIMNASELLSERDLLLQRVTHAAIPSRDRGGISSFSGTPINLLNEIGRPGRHRLNCISLDNL